MKKKIGLIVTLISACVLIGCGEVKETNDLLESSANSNVEASVENEETPSVEEPTPEPTKSPEEELADIIEEGKNYYYALNGVTADKDKALEAFKKATESDNAEAYLYMGIIYEDSDRLDEAKIAYEKAVELGSSLAKVYLGSMYFNAAGVELNYNKARELYEEAISEGCVEGNIGIADFCLSGNGDYEPDASKALECYELVVNNGTDRKIISLAYMSLMNAYVGIFDGIEKDITKLEEYATKYEETCKGWNDEECNHNIGLAYDYAEEYDLARERYEKTEYDRSLYQLGWWYANGSGGVEQDYTKAMEYFEKAAQKGHATAMNWIGYFYENGLGVDKNIETAIEWYLKQGEAGGGAGYNRVGLLYYKGEEVAQDYVKAYDYFLKGADLGDETAFANVAWCYRNGYGTEMDLEKAAEYYAKADYYGNSEGSESLQEMVDAGEITEETKTKWMEYYYKN